MKLSYYFENTSEFPLPQLFDGVEYPWQVLAAADRLLAEILVRDGVRDMRGEARGECRFEGAYSVGEGTVIHHGAVIHGPVYIGRKCKIQSGALLRPGTVLGDGCEVGHGSEVKHTVLQNGAKVASLSFVGDSVLGRSARIGSGMITANRKFDQSRVFARVEGERVDTGTDFLGLVLGDYARVGANCVTQPGTLIGPHTWIYPGTVVRGFIPRQKRVYYQIPLVFEDNEIVELKP